MADQDQYIHLREISVDFIERRPMSDLQLVLEDSAGVKYESNKFTEGDLVHWNIDTYIRTHTNATLTIKRQPLFDIVIVAEILVQFEPNEFGDGRAVELEDYTHRVTVKFVCGRSKSLADVIRIHRLNNDVLLGIFNCYRLNMYNWNSRLGWCKLSHVCQRWRHLIFESSFHLGIYIECTHGTPVVDTLDHLPPLCYRTTNFTIFPLPLL